MQLFITDLFQLTLQNKIQHQNIVSLLGYCIHGEGHYLVYEMMHDGSLELKLHSNDIFSPNGMILTNRMLIKILEFLEDLFCCSIFWIVKSPHLKYKSKYNIYLKICEKIIFKDSKILRTDSGSNLHYTHCHTFNIKYE